MTDDTNSSTALPLAGIKVIELGQNIAGPYAGEILSSLGAEVVKIERPGTGDDARGWGPPFWRGTATTFQAMNHGKKSIALDLKDPAQAQWLRERAAEADVFVQNMRPGSLEELGLGAEALRALNPRLVYCSLWAFGHKGPMRLAPGYEPMVQAFAGIFSINGAESGPSARVGMQVLDLGTGVWAALGCIAALLRRASTGQGCVVDTSLFETALGWLQVMMAGFHATGKQPERHRSGNPNVVVFQALPTGDGEIDRQHGKPGARARGGRLYREGHGNLHIDGMKRKMAARPRAAAMLHQSLSAPDLMASLAFSFTSP